MAQPAYLLNVERFDALLKRFHYSSLQEFSEKTGMKTRTLSEVRSGNRELSLRNVLRLRRGLEGVSFDSLFYENPDFVDDELPAAA